MSEDALIAALRAILEPPSGAADAKKSTVAARPQPAPRRIVLGIGDDAAVWQPSRSHLSVITTDALVDGVHFLGTAMAASAIGHRALASNLSDIAAMGARPVLATVALGLPPTTSERWIVDCYRGMAALAQTSGTRIVGGDIVRSPALMLSLTVVGEVARMRLRRRDGGRPGDVLAVTGPLGLSRAGLELMRRPDLAVPRAVRDVALAAFATPVPRLREGQWLGASAHVHAMMDLSDGMSTDLARLAAASACGALLDDIPLHAVVRTVALAAGERPERYALDGGEDFELLLSVAARAFPHLAHRFAARFGRPLVPVGRLEAAAGVRVSVDGAIRPLAAGGYDHLDRSPLPGP